MPGDRQNRQSNSGLGRTWACTMSELRFVKYMMPAADLGDENPLPALLPAAKPSAKMQYDASLSAEDVRYFGYGGTGVLPHGLQDGYGRDLRPRQFQAAVLENDLLRATFLPQLGGRLWSLVHKPSGRELLDVAQKFQPANLAVRHAWFSGGVEWNVGVIGHHPQTCSPLFAARSAGPGGQPALRMYEWERTRCAPYQIDTYLPDGSAWLYVRVGLVNPHDEAIPMYWWSNIAVEEHKDVRVLAPATQAITHGYKLGVGKRPVPIYNGVDQSYPVNAKASADWFFCIPDGQRRWIAALDAQGRGLVQTSTDLLRGRKLFVWGMGAGGRHWQEFLSGPGRAYIEIQAGLGRTQMECVPMPAHAQWSWLEAYGLMEADAPSVHGDDWPAACAEVESRLQRQLPREGLEAELARADRAAAMPPIEIVQHGSGWGALERRRRQHAGQPPFAGEAIPFLDDSLGAAQAPWLALLESGQMHASPVEDPPASWMVQEEWEALLTRSLAGRGDHWLARLNLGVMLYHRGLTVEGKAAWDESLRRTPSAWAMRNLALAARHEGRMQDAANLYVAARKLLPDLPQLAIECVEALLDADRPAEALDVLTAMPAALAANGRLRLLHAKTAIAAGQPDAAIKILQADLVVADVREGEISLSDLWFQAHLKRHAMEHSVPIDEPLRELIRREYPPPRHLDFRMTADG